MFGLSVSQLFSLSWVFSGYRDLQCDMFCLLLSIVSCVTSLRVTRSATDCPEVVVSNFSSPRLQVFLTVNSRARVHWDGTFEKRKIELNWVNPTDRHDGDTVGLFNNDPQWFGTGNPLIQVNIEKRAKKQIKNRNFM